MGAPAALVLVPGLLCDAAVWAPQLPALRALAGVQVAQHGLCDSLAGMADAIIESAPERFALAGHSMGGRVALEVYRRAPERITGLALLDTGCHAPAVGAAGEAERRGRMELVDLAQRAGMRVMALQWLQGMLHPTRLDDAPLVDAICDMICRHTTAHYAAQTAALLSRPEAGPLLPGIHCPSLVLCGREDRWAAVPQHAEMAAAIPRCMLRIVGQCGHMCTLEQPDAVTRHLCEWLAVCA